MIRQQMYLTEDQKHALELLSKLERKPQAEIAREAIDIGIKAKQKQKGNAGAALLRFATEAPIHGMPKDGSLNIDKYLYEDQ